MLSKISDSNFAIAFTVNLFLSAENHRFSVKSKLLLLLMYSASTFCWHGSSKFFSVLYSIEDVKEKLSSLINDIKIWMNGRKLKLNDGKTDIIIVKGNLRSSVVEEFGDLE